MINFEKHKRFESEIDSCFTIIIPTWNNISYLKLCLESIQNHSSYQHQIIICINEGLDGTKEWVENETNYDYIYAKNNIGICYALNACRSLINSDYVVYANDDMYFLPNWDKAILNKIEYIKRSNSAENNYFMLSSTLIEPSGNNPCVVVKDYGDSIETFKKKELLNEYSKLNREDWKGSTWPPVLLPLDCWDVVGGMSVEFHPGMYSDPDLSKKIYDLGVRCFIGIGDSLVYHFGCKSTKRVRKNKGRNMFVLKWGITSKTFTKFYLKRGEDFSKKEEANNTNLPTSKSIVQLFNRIKSCF